MTTEISKSITFRFIDVGDAAPARKKKNASLARSHVMSELRKAQREERDKKKKRQIKSKDASTKTLSSTESPFLAKHNKSMQDSFWEPLFPGILWSLCLSQNIKSVAVSRSAFVERDLNVLREYTGVVSPYLHELIDHGKWNRSVIPISSF